VHVSVGDRAGLEIHPIAAHQPLGGRIQFDAAVQQRASLLLMIAEQRPAQRFTLDAGRRDVGGAGADVVEDRVRPADRGSAGMVPERESQ